MYFRDGRAYLSYKSMEYAWRHNFVIIIPWIRNKQGPLSIHVSFFWSNDNWNALAMRYFREGFKRMNGIFHSITVVEIDNPHIVLNVAIFTSLMSGSSSSGLVFKFVCWNLMNLSVPNKYFKLVLILCFLCISRVWKYFSGKVSYSLTVTIIFRKFTLPPPGKMSLNFQQKYCQFCIMRLSAGWKQNQKTLMFFERSFLPSKKRISTLIFSHKPKYSLSSHPPS